MQRKRMQELGGYHPSGPARAGRCGQVLVPSLPLCPGLQAKGVMKTASSYRWVCSLQSCHFLLPTVGGTRHPLGLGNFTPGDSGWPARSILARVEDASPPTQAKESLPTARTQAEAPGNRYLQS